MVDLVLSRIYDAEDATKEALSSRNAPDPDFMPLDWMGAQVKFAQAMAFLDEAPEEIMSALGAYGDRIAAAIPKPPPALPAPGSPPGAGAPMPPPIVQGPPQAVPAGQAPPQAA